MHIYHGLCDVRERARRDVHQNIASGAYINIFVPLYWAFPRLQVGKSLNLAVK